MKSETTATGLQAVLLASLLVVGIFAMTTPIAGATTNTNGAAAVAGNVAIADAAQLPSSSGVTVAVEVTDSDGTVVNATEREITNTDPGFTYELEVPAGTYDVTATVTGASGDASAADYETVDVETSGDGLEVASGETATDVDVAITETLDTALQHQRTSAGASGSGGWNGPSVVAEALMIETVDGEPFTVGGDRDVGLTIRNTETDDEVMIRPENRSSFAATGFDLGHVYDSDGSIHPTPQIGIEGPNIDGQANVNVSVVSADAATFNDSVFASYEVDLVTDVSSSAPEVVTTTQPRLIGIGYEGSLTQNSTHGTIEFTYPRSAAVDETWDVEFDLRNDDGAPGADLPKPVTNQAGDEQFVARVNVSDIPSGTYSWHLEMYPAEPQFGSERQLGDRILGTFGVDDVTIQRANVTFAPEHPDPGETVTFDASGSAATEGEIAEYRWAFGDGSTTTTTGPTVEHAYDAAGDYDVQLTVVDTAGNEEQTTRTVNVANTTAIEGQFTRADGQSAAGDTVIVSTTDGPEMVTTDDTGAFSIAVPARNDPYSVQYYQADLTQPRFSDPFPADGNVDIHAMEVPGAEDTDLGEVALPEGHRVTASVTDETGAPVEDALLYWGDQDAESDASAGYAFTTNADGLAEIDGIVVEGIELSGQAEALARPPSDADRFTDHTYVEPLDVTSEEDLTFTLETGAVASYRATPTEPAVDESVTFDASGSSADAAIEEYVWDFGNGETRTTTDPVVTFAFPEAGDHDVSLTIRDADGTEDTITRTISVGTDDGGDDGADTGDGTDDDDGSYVGGGTDDGDDSDAADDDETSDSDSASGAESFNVTASETVTYEDDDPDAPGTTVRTTNTSVSAITFDDDGNSSGGNVTVSDVDEPPSTTGAPAGSTVSVVEISVPEDRRDTPATLEVSVDRERVDALEADEDELTVQRFNESAGAWETLQTEVVSSGEDAVVLEAATPGFSYFAVTAPGEDGESGADDGSTATSTPEETATETPSDDETATETDASTDAESDDQPGFGAGVALLALLGAALLARRQQ